MSLSWVKSKATGQTMKPNFEDAPISVWKEKARIAKVNNDTSLEDRQRTAAHELAHHMYAEHLRVESRGITLGRTTGQPVLLTCELHCSLSHRLSPPMILVVSPCLVELLPCGHRRGLADDEQRAQLAFPCVCLTRCWRKLTGWRTMNGGPVAMRSVYCWKGLGTAGAKEQHSP